MTRAKNLFEMYQLSVITMIAFHFAIRLPNCTKPNAWLVNQHLKIDVNIFLVTCDIKLLHSLKGVMSTVFV